MFAKVGPQWIDRFKTDSDMGLSGGPPAFILRDRNGRTAPMNGKGNVPRVLGLTGSADSTRI
jgi:hypothetical protein